MAERGGIAEPFSGPQAELEALRASYDPSPKVDPPEMIATREEMKEAKVPLPFRNYCAHLLIPLNECRKATFYSPFQCSDLRHAYEKCEFDEYTRRRAIYKEANA